MPTNPDNLARGGPRGLDLDQFYGLFRNKIDGQLGVAKPMLPKGGRCVSFEKVLLEIHGGDFEMAVSSWRELSAPVLGPLFDGRYDGSIWEQTLEARLVYLTLIGDDDGGIANALARYRKWLLTQKSSIAGWGKIGAAPLTLPDHLLVHQPEIDADHRALFAMANRVRDALRANDPVAAATLASVMLDEIVEHFAREEAILRNAGYPDAAGHGVYHGQLRDKSEQLRELMAELAEGGSDRLAIFSALVSFLINDPVVADLDFRPFFLARE